MQSFAALQRFIIHGASAVVTHWTLNTSQRTEALDLWGIRSMRITIQEMMQLSSFGEEKCSIWCSKTRNFVFKNEEFCIYNDEFCRCQLESWRWTFPHGGAHQSNYCKCCVFHIQWPLVCHFVTQNRCILNDFGWKEWPFNVKSAVRPSSASLCAISERALGLREHNLSLHSIGTKVWGDTDHVDLSAVAQFVKYLLPMA